MACLVSCIMEMHISPLFPEHVSYLEDFFFFLENASSRSSRSVTVARVFGRVRDSECLYLYNLYQTDSTILNLLACETFPDDTLKVF